MPSSFQQAIKLIRSEAKNDTELGTAFEKLSKVFFEHDPIQTQQYSQVWHYSDWAKQNKFVSKKDIGIDLVAKIRGEDTYCAIQCKCYSPDHSISKADIDSFISASSTNDFSRLILIDTSTQNIGKNAQITLNNLDKDYLRIQGAELEQSKIDWLTFIRDEKVIIDDKKELRDHQIKALNEVKNGFENSDRGKLIMACGTGKTFLSLRIAEEIAGKGRKVLYMVPSLSLMSQTVREWKNDARADFNAFSACSDNKVGRRNSSDDLIEVRLNDLSFPATTDAEKLAEQINKTEKEKMTVIFSTYQSIDVISKAQNEYNLSEFDLIICDEAHRTTGATLVGDDESNFVRIHNNKNIKGTKRLYMTATPKIYSDKAKKQANEGETSIASMDDENIFGKVFYYLSFGEAVEKNLLSDYKVVVLAVDSGVVSNNLQRSWEEGSELNLDDATKIIGCYKALAKIGFNDDKKEDEIIDNKPIKRALAFCQNINISEIFEKEFVGVIDEFQSNENIKEKYKTNLDVKIKHVDGSFNAERRSERLGWLKDDVKKNECHVLTNVRCLSEGVDVPSLDAIMFLHPRKSQIDVVQAVGRVMRKAEGKNLGYVVLPVAVAPEVSAEKALNDNERYRVVWQILNALRAHDERFDSTINQLGIGEDVTNRLQILRVSSEELEATTAVVDEIKPKYEKKEEEGEVGLNEDQKEEESIDENLEPELPYIVDDLSKAIKAKIVEKCGTRDYWENWATDIAKIAKQHIIRIKGIVQNQKNPERKIFLKFLEEIQDDLNPQITEIDAIEMLAQHIITKPVFDTLFQNNEFSNENAISKAMELILKKLNQKNIQIESKNLIKFYESVKRRSKDIITAEGRQRLVLELYDRFFRNAFPLMTQKLGIVYTPTEVVDFILYSVNDILKEEFNKTLSEKNTHIIDPFTGTGTFITRLLQSNLINKENLPYKYKNEIHANEIILLAYYIAGINIESVYQDLIRENQYQPFNGLVLTDTFQLYEQERDMINDLLPDNSNKRTAQKNREIKIIIGNPPYSSGQSSANDNAQNVSYPNLENSIKINYSNTSSSTLKNSLYDSYIKAFRWATERIKDEGIIGFVTNAGWIDSFATDGLRKNFSSEFNKIYILNLRGNQRTKGEISRKEGGKIFGSGSRTPIAITFLVKNKKNNKKAEINYYDIGDYLKRDQKLSIIKNFKSIKQLKQQKKFKRIIPDENFDWINQGNKEYQKFIPLRDETKDKLFIKWGPGISTSRDAWAFNASKNKIDKNINYLIKNYNREIDLGTNPKEAFEIKTSKIDWSSGLKNEYKKKKKLNFNEGKIIQSLYRPFSKQHLYLSTSLTERKGITPNFFNNENDKVIVISGRGSRNFSCLMTNINFCMDLIEKAQGYPLKVYNTTEDQNNLFISNPDNIAISQTILTNLQKKYKSSKISNDNIFSYVYGILHSEDFREIFQNNLIKDHPRIPFVNKYNDFLKFVDAGKKLENLHINYEKISPYPVTFKEGDLRFAGISDSKAFYRVEKMKFGKSKGKEDKTIVKYNNNLTIINIPLGAYNYIINGKPALEWIMERQVVKKDNASGIINDCNDYANETLNNPAYPLELFQRVITVSLETMKIIKSLPKLDIN